MVFLMGVMKSIEVGAFMSLAELLPSEDTAAAIVLSSVAARQNGMLRAYVSANASMASFETPLSGTWAYNLAHAYARLGSWAVDLPIPILPVLSVNNRMAGYAR
ncbi:hypothetical protein GQ44DRAFT_710396, partial [Phaeosphaeriaceae sp. PMI808]